MTISIYKLNWYHHGNNLILKPHPLDPRVTWSIYKMVARYIAGLKLAT